MWKFAKPFLYFCVLFSATAVLFDWIKFDVWNQVVLVSCCSRTTFEQAYHDNSTTFQALMMEVKGIFVNTSKLQSIGICRTS